MTDELTLPGPLVDTAWLAANLGHPALRLYECTVQLLPDPPRVYRIESGRGHYDAGHIPGAAFIDLIESCSDPGSDLPFTNPPPAQLAAALAAAGIGDDSVVVVYAATMPWATRLWWMLRNLGFDRAAVLNGGIEKWRAEGRPLSEAAHVYPPASLSARADRGLFVDKATVHAHLEDPGVAVVNALSPQMHSGEAPVNYGRPGHIAGSHNVFFQELLDADACDVFRDDASLAACFSEAGISGQQQVIAYCGGGIAATVDAFALHLLGRECAVYDGSMTEWANDPDMPMATG